MDEAFATVEGQLDVAQGAGVVSLALEELARAVVDATCHGDVDSDGYLDLYFSTYAASVASDSDGAVGVDDAASALLAARLNACVGAVCKDHPDQCTAATHSLLVEALVASVDRDEVLAALKEMPQRGCTPTVVRAPPPARVSLRVPE